MPKPPAPRPLKTRVSALMRYLRALSEARQAGPGPRILMLPNQRQAGSSLVRVYDMVAPLQAEGWQAVIADPVLTKGQRHALARAFAPDVLLVQLARHPLNRVEHLPPGVPYVMDLDDADFHDPDLAEPMAQLAAGAAGVICGSRYIESWARRHTDNTCISWTGNAPTPQAPPPQAGRAPILCWAQAAPRDYPEEMALMRGLVAQLHQSGVSFRLRLYDRDPDALRQTLSDLTAQGVEIEVLPLMPYRDFLMSLRDVAVGLSPVCIQSDYSRGKSFGKILGYLDAGVPVICSDEADHSLFFTPGTGVVSNDMALWQETAAQWLTDPAARQSVAEAAYERYLEALSAAAAAHRWAQFLDALPRKT